LASVVGDKIVFQVVQAKKPVANGELLVVDRDGKTHEVRTGPHGKWSLPRKSGRYLVRAKVGKAIAGQYQGQEYTEKRNYCTLVLDVGEVLDVNDLPVGQGKGARTSGKKKLADLPKGLTSFGGAVSNNRVFISGGHTGKAHSYYESGQNQTLYALDLDHPDQWKKIADGLGLQGLALVAHKGSLYRIGGFHAHNKEGEKQDLRSVKDFAVFDFEKKAWKQLEPMPVGRSSFDAVVVKGKVYVVGGWTMNGAAETQWCGTAISLDLNDKNAKWEQLPDPPFKRRALSVGFQKNKLVVIGGMQPKGGPTQKVSLYDLGSKEWTEGPLLPGEEAMEGFGSSCFNVGGQLIVSTYGGNVLRMKDDFSSWETIERLDEGRFFHRLLPLNQSEFILVGGANMEVGKFHEIKVLSID
jgi:hypothetical protein